MIVKSRVASSPYFRRTQIAEPGAKTFSSVLQNLLIQWDIIKAGSDPSSVSQYSLLTTVEGDELLIVDKQSEWNLLCKDSVVEDQESIVEVEIIKKSDVFVKERTARSLVLPASDTTAVQREAKFNQAIHASGDKHSESSSRVTSPPVRTSYGFQSVEPHAPKSQRRTFAPYQSNEEAEEKPKQPPFQLLTMDEIMARSRAQGESLNQLFGTMQARSAGRPHETDQAPSAQVSANASTSAISALPAPTQSNTNIVEGDEEMSASQHPAPLKTNEEIAEHNKRTEALWQERLAQMGHGPNSNSAYNRTRLGKTTSREESSAEIVTNASSTSSDMDLPPLSNLSANRSPLVALDEVNEESTSRQPSQTFPTYTILQTPELEQGDSPFLEGGRWRRSRPGSVGGQSTPGQEESTSRPSSLRARLFRRRRHLSDVAGSRGVHTRGENAVISGTSTPRSFNSIVFRRQRRPINARSLSDALLSTARSRPGSEDGTNDDAGAPFDRPEGTRSRTQMSSLLPKALRVGRRKSSPNITAQQEVRCREATQSHGTSSDHDPITTAARAATSPRPSLMRASHSSPLSATAVNLTAADGITLHIASVSPSSFNIEREAASARHDGKHASKLERNLFEIMLPRELRIACIRSLIALHADEALTLHGSDGREVQRYGKTTAMRELVRLSRVSSQWQSLVFDGQLWQDMDLSIARDISHDCLVRLLKTAGPFVKRLNLSNMHGLDSRTLRNVTTYSEADQQLHRTTRPRVVRAKSAARLTSPTTNPALIDVLFTSLTDLNLGGCRSVSTGALHHALTKFPQLRRLNVTAMPAVENDTLLLLGASLPNLSALNVSRCAHLTGSGVGSFIDAAQGSLYDRSLFTKQKKYPDVCDIILPMTELRVAGLQDVDNGLMASIGRSMPGLQVLDISHAADLTDDAIAAFVRHPGPDRCESKHRPHLYSNKTPKKHDSSSGPFVSLSARQSGGDPLFEGAFYRRCFESLRQLNLSSCRSLTDRSCAHLAFAVPRLQVLELSNIGNSLRDDGIIKLLETTNLIERIDVEGASELTTPFVQALTPPVSYVESLGLQVPSENTAPVARLSRRSARRARTTNTAEGPQGVTSTRKAKEDGNADLPTGAHLTHLNASHLTRVDVNSLLNLVRRCPRLHHLELDDTRASDAVLMEFVNLARQRRKKGAYVSLVDCRAVSKASNAEVFAAGSARPREGKIAEEFLPFIYETQALQSAAVNKAVSNSPLRASSPFAAVSAAVSSTANGAPDECDQSLVVVKTFWAWQTVDVRIRFKRRAEAKRLAALGQGRTNPDGERRPRDSLAAALSYLSNGGSGAGAYESDEDEGQGRWGRFASNLLGNGDEGDDARGCSIM